jgi:hypothetical protein
VSVGYVKSSVSKADALNPADESYMFCSLVHLDSRYSILDARYSIRASSISILIRNRSLCKGRTMNSNNSQRD